jgi:hypothetical protein
VKECIACAEEIKENARLCRFCGTQQDDSRFVQPIEFDGRESFNEEAFRENWANSTSLSGPFEPLVTRFIEWDVDNQLSVRARFELASSSQNAGVLALLAFDKAHFALPGDIRVAVVANPFTSIETKEMITENEDRLDWNWEDWLDFENDDWTADVDMVVEYGTDIANEVIEECRRAALR